MSLYVFDTDLLTLFREGHPVVCARAAAHSADELATSAVIGSSRALKRQPETNCRAASKPDR